MVQGLHVSSVMGICIWFSAGIFHALNPAQGCVAPHIDRVSTPSIAARCIFDESIAIIRSSLEISAISSSSPVSYTHLRAHETRHDLVCRLLLEKKKISRNKE